MCAMRFALSGARLFRGHVIQTALVAAFFVLGDAGAGYANSARIEATSDTKDWNAVALAAGQVFVGGPHWTEFPGPSVAVITKSEALEPFPTAEWNHWKPGLDAAHRFVNVNALHIGPDGSLWVVDTGSPRFGGTIVKNGAKLVRLNPATGAIIRIYPFGPDVAPDGSYIDDIRINGAHAYLTDAGKGALLVVDIESGSVRRVLDGNPATMARRDRPIIVDGETVRSSDGSPLRVNVDPLEVSPDGGTLYFGPLEGPWSQVPTAALDDPSVSPARLAALVKPWADLPPIGGSIMDEHGRLYYSALADDTIYCRMPTGETIKLLTDHRLHWADAPFLTKDRRLWFPVAQLDRLPLFQHGVSKIQKPFIVMSVSINP